MAKRRKSTKARSARRTKRSHKRAKRRVTQARNRFGQFTSKRVKSRR